MLTLPSVAMASDSLCDLPQKVFINSETANGKYISFCTSDKWNDVAPIKELQYRYGTKNNIEIYYPSSTTYAAVRHIEDPSEVENHDRPMTAQQYKSNEFILARVAYSGGGGMFISFKNHKYIYHYHSAIIKVNMRQHEEIEFLGVYKEGNETPVATIRALNDGRISE